MLRFLVKGSILIFALIVISALTYIIFSDTFGNINEKDTSEKTILEFIFLVVIGFLFLLNWMGDKFIESITGEKSSWTREEKRLAQENYTKYGVRYPYYIPYYLQLKYDGWIPGKDYKIIPEIERDRDSLEEKWKVDTYSHKHKRRVI